MQFNEMKTVCICFDYESGNLDIPIYLGSSKLNWCDKVKHLGNYISRSLSDIEDVNYKVSTFIRPLNKLMAKFGDLQSHILENLFTAYCTSYYGVHLWSLNGKYVKKFNVSWPKAIRHIWKLPNTTQVPLLKYLINQEMHVSEQNNTQIC